MEAQKWTQRRKEIKEGLDFCPLNRKHKFNVLGKKILWARDIDSMNNEKKKLSLCCCFINLSLII